MIPVYFYFLPPQQEFAHEAEIMTKLKHPLLVSLLGVCMKQRPWMLILEAMTYGNLKSCLQVCCRAETKPR